jgi:hypothetical protein
MIFAQLARKEWEQVVNMSDRTRAAWQRRKFEGDSCDTARWQAWERTKPGAMPHVVEQCLIMCTDTDQSLLDIIMSEACMSCALLEP